MVRDWSGLLERFSNLGERPEPFVFEDGVGVASFLQFVVDVSECFLCGCEGFTQDGFFFAHFGLL
jgi:hypothetical protein